MNILLASFVLAQGADLLTGLMLPSGAEANPIVLWLGLPIAACVKVGLILYTWAVTRIIDHRLAAATLAFGALVGLVGFASNMAWLGGAS